MIGLLYPTKKALKESVGKQLRYEETSMFGSELKANRWICGVGPSPYVRKWYANIMVDENDVLVGAK